MNILVLPGTTLVAREICNSLWSAKGIQLYGAGYDVTSAKTFPYNGFDFVGTLDQKFLINDLEEIVLRRDIDSILLAHDSWLFEFRNLNFIGKAKIMKSSCASIEVSSFKSRTYETLKGVVPTPLVFNSLKEILDFPVFLKPNRGQGSVGSLKINSPIELEQYAGGNGFFGREWVISEHLPGAEFTVDCFSDSRGGLKYSSPRIRLSIESGLAVDTRLIEHPELVNWAKLINQELKIEGPWFFQAKEGAEGSLKLMELGLRIAGGSGVQRLKGINLSQMSVWQLQGHEIEIIEQSTFPGKVSKAKCLDFEFQQIYVDYDDTLVFAGRVNLMLVEFLKDSITRGIEVTLITRHAGNLEYSLNQLSLTELFARIIHITNLDPKSKYINSTDNFLFIDDSFRERQEVSMQFGKQALVLDESFVVG